MFTNIHATQNIERGSAKCPKCTINNMNYKHSQSNSTNQNSQTLQITLTNLTTTSINKIAHKDKLTYKPHTHKLTIQKPQYTQCCCHTNKTNYQLTNTDIFKPKKKLPNYSLKKLIHIFLKVFFSPHMGGSVEEKPPTS